MYPPSSPRGWERCQDLAREYNHSALAPSGLSRTALGTLHWGDSFPFQFPKPSWPPGIDCAGSGFRQWHGKFHLPAFEADGTTPVAFLRGARGRATFGLLLDSFVALGMLMVRTRRVRPSR